MKRPDLLNTTAIKAPEPASPSLTITSAAISALQIGDFVTMPMRLSRRERLLLWLARPWRWPAKTHQAEMRVTATVSSTSAETEWLR